MQSSEESRKVISTAGLLLVDAMVFQEVIASAHKDVLTLSRLMESPNPKKDMEESWRYIITNIDYEPVLDIALRILSSVPVSPSVNQQLKQLMSLAYDIASSKVLLRHDLFGRIYHTLLLGKLVKYYATYYTSIPAARLLARLLITLPSDLVVKEVPPLYAGEPLRVVDFACGSGTLLSAIYKEVDARYRIEAEDLRIDDLHRYLIEEGIWGFDVLHHAVHLAATVLSLHNPVPVKGSRLFALPLGQGKHLGSLDFLTSDRLTPAFTGDSIAGGGERISVRGKEKEEIKLPDFHVCIMNPPFTRSVGGNLLFGSLPKKERAELQKELRRVLKQENLAGIGQAGLGPVFAFLADEYLTQEGRLGLVLPRAVLSGVSWEKVREKLLREYHVEYVITSYEAPDGWNFSENTALSEVLIVAKKSGKRTEESQGTGPDYTLFVNLWKKPSNEIESIYMGTQLTEIFGKGKLYDVTNSNASPYHLKLHGRKVGEVYSARLTDENFGICNVFSQMELNRVIVLLRQGIIYLPDEGVVGKIPITSLSKLGAEVGPDRSQVHSAFGVSTTKTPYKALWGYDSSINKTISQASNAYLEPKDAEQARDLWRKRGNLLIVERARLSTYPILATNLEEGVLSNVWWPVSVQDDAAKILAVWLNSTLGLLLLLSNIVVTQGPWVDIKKEHLQVMPILNVKKLAEKSRKALLNLYDQTIGDRKICDSELKALPEEFRSPGTRKVIDDGVAEALGLKLNLDALYELLSVEPMITGK